MEESLENVHSHHHGHDDKQCCQTINSISDSSLTNISSSTICDCTGAVEQADLEGGVYSCKHVIFKVEGMDCSGCEAKLEKVLSSIPGVTRPRACLALARLECDWQGGCTEQLLKRVQATTGYKCAIATTRASSLELVTSLSESEIGNIHIHGADIVRTGKSTLRVEYCPKTIGARDLFKRMGPSCSLAPLRIPAHLEAGRREIRNHFIITAVAILLTIPILLLEWGAVSVPRLLAESVCLVLASIVQIFIGGPFYIRAFRSLFRAKMVEVDMLVVISTTTAYCLSVVSFVFQALQKSISLGNFFAASALLITVIVIGRLVSSFARVRALELTSAHSNQPKIATITDLDSRQDFEVDTRLLQYGDIFKVVPDSTIVTDGIVVSGISDVDESVISGEQLPIAKAPKSRVFAGSRSMSGTLLIQLTHLPDENSLRDISRMVDDAKMSKARVQDIADKIAGVFVPFVLVLAAIVLVVWTVVGIKRQHKTGTESFIQALLYVTSMLIISCPCAIGLAVPMVIVVAGGVAASHGFIFKSAASMLKARRVSHVIFDKTGTITEDRLDVSYEHYATRQNEPLISLVLAMVNSSRHPVSASLKSHLEAAGSKPTNVETIESITGKGVICSRQGVSYRLGSPHWLSLDNNLMVRCLLSRGSTVCCLTDDSGQLLALFGLSAQIRPSAIKTISALRRQGVDVSILSGDGPNAVHLLAKSLDVPTSHVRALCSPAQKCEYVSNAAKERNAVTLFIGDGTNDAPALAAADIGVHLQNNNSTGFAELPKMAADVIVFSSDLHAILKITSLSRIAHRRIGFNFVWAFSYNFIAFTLASGILGWKGIWIPPQYAAIGEVVSILPVIAAALCMRWVRL